MSSGGIQVTPDVRSDNAIFRGEVTRDIHQKLAPEMKAIVASVAAVTQQVDGLTTAQTILTGYVDVLAKDQQRHELAVARHVSSLSTELAAYVAQAASDRNDLAVRLDAIVRLIEERTLLGRIHYWTARLKAWWGNNG